MKKEEVIKDPHQTTISNVLQSVNQPLSQAKNANFTSGRLKNDEQKNRKKVIHKDCVTLFINSNRLRSIYTLYETLGTVMWGHEKLQWIDLSYNLLVKIEPEILKFTQLKTLYLHGNFIYEMAEVVKLGDLEHLRVLTLHGNEIEQIPGYRMYVLGIILAKNPNLKKLDTVMIT